MHGHIAAAKFLLQRGAESTRSRRLFDHSGTGLHYAALNGHRTMVEFLIDQGADATIKDTKVFGTPADWADHGGHPEIKEVLRRSLDQ